MSVYKEGFKALGFIAARSTQIFNDAADFGAPTKKHDVLWNCAKQVVEMYGTKTTKSIIRYNVGSSVEIDIILMDEWDTGKEVTYKLMYVTCKTGKCKGYQGYLTVAPVDKGALLMLTKYGK